MSKLKDQLKHFAGDANQSLLTEDGEVDVAARGRPPTEAELNQDYVAPGQDALLPYGITFTAMWKIFADGMAKHSREQVLALAEAGLPVRLQSFGEQNLLSDDRHPDVENASYLENVSFSRVGIAIKHFILHNPDLARQLIFPYQNTFDHLVSWNPEKAGSEMSTKEQIYRSTIVYTSWERDRVHPDLIDAVKNVGQLWVPCVANRDAFVSSGMPEDKVKVVPFPYDPSTCRIAAPRGSEDVPQGKRYYSIGKWEPRKNHHRLIGAFLLAHTPKDAASLFIKTSRFGGSWPGYPSAAESICFWLSQPDVKERGWDSKSLDRLVRIVSEKIPEEELINIHKRNNIYVSASCGEAWDIPAFDAKLAGNRLVYSGFGGSEEYAEQDDERVSWDFEPVNPAYGWEPDAQWASVTAKSLAEAMTRAQPPEIRRTPPSYVSRFSRHAVGELMKDLIREHAEKLGCWKLLEESGGFG